MSGQSNSIPLLRSHHDAWATTPWHQSHTGSRRHDPIVAVCDKGEDRADSSPISWYLAGCHCRKYVLPGNSSWSLLTRKLVTFELVPAKTATNLLFVSYFAQPYSHPAEKKGIIGEVIIYEQLRFVKHKDNHVDTFLRSIRLPKCSCIFSRQYGVVVA